MGIKRKQGNWQNNMVTNSKKDIFDEISDISIDSDGDVFDQISGTIETKPRKYTGVAKQAALGGAKGLLGSYGNILDLFGAQPEGILPGEQTRRELESDILDKIEKGHKPSVGEILMLSDDELAPAYSKLPSSEDVEKLAQMLGIHTEPQSAPERFAQRIGEAVGSAGAFGGGPGVTAALAGGALAGQTAEELGAPASIATGVEIGSALLPGGLKKALSPKSKVLKDLVKKGRAAGLTESELTPLVQGEKKLRSLSKVARKGTKTEKLFSQIESKLGDSYQGIKINASKLPMLNLEQSEGLLEGMGKVNKDLRTTLKAAPDKESAIKFIEGAMENIRNRGVNPEELIGFWQDINQSVNWNAIRGGKKSLAELKKPILEALKTSSPELASDFEITNQLYSKFKKASKALKPDIIDKWLLKGEIGAVALGIGTGNLNLLKKVAAESALRTLSREMLINPRLQNISNKMLKAVRNNKPVAISQLAKHAKNILEKEQPEESWDFLVED